jgi:hypothetical protein
MKVDCTICSARSCFLGRKELISDHSGNIEHVELFLVLGDASIVNDHHAIAEGHAR